MSRAVNLHTEDKRANASVIALEYTFSTLKVLVIQLSKQRTKFFRNALRWARPNQTFKSMAKIPHRANESSRIIF